MNNSFIENRDKYYVETKKGKKVNVAEIQKEIVIIMDEIDRICRKHDIKYFLIAGSSLGSVNYGGFIPWDDDIDVSISIDDWDKFVKVMKEELSKDFYFDCYEYDKRFNTIMGPWMKVRKKGTYIEEVNFLLKNRCKRGNGVFVDVIPYGGISENKFVDEMERTFVKILMPLIVFFDNIHLNPILLKSIVYKFSRWCMEKHKDSKLVSQPVSVPWEKFMHEPVFLKEDVYPVKECTFEGRKYYTYNNPEKILKEWYGNNCLKKLENGKWIEPYPKEKRCAKHVKDVNLNGDFPATK